MTKVTVDGIVDKSSLSAADLAAEYKARGMDKYRAWDQLIIDRNLKPGIDAKEFYKVFEMVTPKVNVIQKTIDYTPTHLDNMLNLTVMITELPSGVFEMVWENGWMTGANPPSNPPIPPRFTKI